MKLQILSNESIFLPAKLLLKFQISLTNKFQVKYNTLPNSNTKQQCILVQLLATVLKNIYLNNIYCTHLSTETEDDNNVSNSVNDEDVGDDNLKLKYGIKIETLSQNVCIY